jgi:hypothetical protein
LVRKRDCSDVLARAMESGKSLAQAPQRGKKTWESEQRLRTPVKLDHWIAGYPRNWQ